MKCVIYCRVSTDEQAKANKTSLELQERECREYAERLGWTVVDVFVEDYTGTTIDRPELNRVMSGVKAGKYDVVLCYKVDRLTRNALNGNLLLAVLRDHNVKIDFVLDNIDLNSDNGNIILQIYFDFAERDRKNTLIKLNDGKRGLLNRNLPINQGVDPYGYLQDSETKHASLVESEVPIVQRIFDLACRGWAKTRIAKELNRSGYTTRLGKRWHPTTITKIIQHPRYKGWTVANCWQVTFENGKRNQQLRPESEWLILDTTGTITPRVVSDEVWEQANRRIRERGTSYATRNESRFYLLRGRIYCGKCGNRMYVVSANKSNTYYVCATRQRRYQDKVIGDPQPTCDCPHIPVEVAHAAVWDQIVDSLEHPEQLVERALKEAERGPDESLLTDERQVLRLIDDCKNREEKLRRRIAEEDDDELRGDLKADWRQVRNRREEAEGRLIEIVGELAKQRAEVERILEFADYVQRFGDPEFWRAADDELKVAALNGFDVKAEVQSRTEFTLQYYGRGLVEDEHTSANTFGNYQRPLVTFHIQLAA